MESIVDTSSIENFLTDSIIQCIQIIEGISTYSSKYNIQVCAALLKSNKQFHSLCKQLYAQYGCFKKIPPEYQLVMIVSTTAYIAQQRNVNKKDINDFLDKPINA